MWRISPEEHATARFRSLPVPWFLPAVQGRTYTVGRRSGTNILVPNSFLRVSGKHCRLTVGADSAAASAPGAAAPLLRLGDIGSTHGTVVNGQFLVVAARAPLVSGVGGGISGGGSGGSGGSGDFSADAGAPFSQPAALHVGGGGGPPSSPGALGQLNNILHSPSSK